jgi:hypothetical protein
VTDLQNTEITFQSSSLASSEAGEIALQSCSFAALEAVDYSSFSAAHALLLIVAGKLEIAAQPSLERHSTGQTCNTRKSPCRVVHLPHQKQ